MVTENDFYLNRLQEQVNLLIDSCHMYDQGSFSHAKIISGIIRTLVKDPVRKAKKSQTISLLTSLNIKDKMSFYNTGYSAKNPTILMNLVGFINAPVYIPSTNDYQFIYVPIFEDSQLIDVPWIDFDDWWETDIIVNKTVGCDIHLSRKKIVLTMAEQDGGVHIDEFHKIDATYRDLITHATNIFTHISTNGTTKPIEYLLYALVRQIAHELLISISKQFSMFKPYTPSNEFVLKGISKEKTIPPIMVALNDGDLSTRTDHPINPDRGLALTAQFDGYVRIEFPT